MNAGTSYNEALTTTLSVDDMMRSVPRFVKAHNLTLCRSVVTHDHKAPISNRISRPVGMESAGGRCPFP